MRRSFQSIADLVEARVCAAVVELGPRCACRACGTDDLVAQLDHHAAAKKHDKRQLGERRDRVLAFRAFSQGEGVVFKGYAGVRLVSRRSSPFLYRDRRASFISTDQW